MAKGKPVVDLEEHFESKLILGHEDGHWSLDTFVNNKGYHTLSVGGGRKKYGHVVAYELYVGPIPADLEVDHLCRVTWCCNPAHLEAVTHSENIRRAHLRAVP
ncbi:HNH endonuclease signature motif containing protein [Streptomyces vietnamensis]|uniref:HNH endonuclease signature motif containing protein n=1 Tax=Streptomyces vietnamensis TaxID=362257 RepID=UPI0037B52291